MLRGQSAVTVTEFFHSHVPFLEGLTEEQAHELASATEQVSYRPFQTVFLQGETVDGLHVVAEGRVVVSVKQRGKDPVRVAELGPGKLFGETSIIDAGVAMATVKTLEETLLFIVPQEVFRGVLDKNPALKERMLAGIASRKSRFAPKA